MSGPVYRLFVPKQAVGANLVYFDLFNAVGSSASIQIMSCVPVVSGAVAVTGLVGVDLHLTKTSAVGTGGTAATRNGTDPTACTISGINTDVLVNTLITARLTPTGGATAGPIVGGWRSVYTEEANAGSYTPVMDMARNLYPDLPGIALPQGQGIRVVQGAVASVGNIGFDVIFRIVPL